VPLFLVAILLRASEWFRWDFSFFSHVIEIGSRQGFIVIGGEGSHGNPLSDVWVSNHPSPKRI
jgi:hypothetical protein